MTVAIQRSNERSAGYGLSPHRRGRHRMSSMLFAFAGPLSRTARRAGNAVLAGDLVGDLAGDSVLNSNDVASTVIITVVILKTGVTLSPAMKPMP